MFGWLKLKKPQPTAAAISWLKGLPRWDSKPPPAAGDRSFDIDTDALKPHPLLSLLPRGTLERLLSSPALAEHPKGTTIFREGEPCDAIFLIVSGRCESRVRTREGVEVEEVLGPGDMLGDRAFLNREPHRSTAVVATHCVLLRIAADELRGFFAQDPSLAGRFAHTVTGQPRSDRPRTGGRVRRVVSLLPLSTRLDAEVVIRRLATALHRITAQRVLLVHLGAPCADDAVPDWVRSVSNFNGEFFFTRHLHEGDAGFDELRLPVGAEPRHVAAMAPLLSHCARYYDYVLLDVRQDVPVPAALECTVESDLAFVLMQPSTQNLYDYQLLIRQLCDTSRGLCAHVKPILFVEESFATPDFHIMLRELGHPVHSLMRGYPLSAAPSWPDHRFDLSINRLAREIGRCRVGLALSSGGAKGLSHIGVLQVLEENGIEIDCLAGSSMGAYIGAIWCYGLDGQMLEKIAREHEGRWGLLSLVDPSFPPRRGFLRARRTIARLRRSIGTAHFSELIRPLRVVATHFDTLERVVFSSGEVAAAVEASIAIPGVVVPVTLDGDTYLDGGIADPLPVDVLEEMGIERIIAVNVIPPPDRIRHWLDAKKEREAHTPPRRSLGHFFNTHLNYLAEGNILDVMMRAVNGAQTRVAEASSRDADVLLRPIEGDSEWHDFTHPKLYIDLGRKVAEAQLSELKALSLSHDTAPSPTPVALRPPLAA